jgi:predicted nucleic acid-binding protein
LYVVDASVWVSRFLAPDKNHALSVQWFRLRRTEGALVVAPTLLFPEFAGAVARQTGAPFAAKALTRLRAIPDVDSHALDENLSLHASELAAELRLKGADAVYAALASTLGFRLVTWDRELRDRARPRIEAYTPADLLT